MDVYDPKYAPAAFGLHNTGVICHFNSLLQALASCTAVVKASLRNKKYLDQTRTGAAFHEYMVAVAASSEAGPALGLVLPKDLALLSTKILTALVLDLRARRPSIRFGNSQESASEGLVLLLDMLQPPTYVEKNEGSSRNIEDVGFDNSGHRANPIARLFYHRYSTTVYCPACSKPSAKDHRQDLFGVSSELDLAVQFNLFHLDAARPATAAAFAESIRSQVVKVDDYLCDRCGLKGAYRRYTLRMLPELMVCLHNLYTPPRHNRYFPKRLPFSAQGGGQLLYRQVAQVEQTGALHGGHYVARGLRSNGKVFLFNDSRFSAAAFGPGPNVYMVFYHIECTPAHLHFLRAQPPEQEAAESPATSQTGHAPFRTPQSPSRDA